MIILRHGTEVSGSMPQRAISEYFINKGAQNIEEKYSKPEETRYFKSKFEFSDVQVNTWEEIEGERDDYDRFVYTYSGRIVLKGPGEKAMAKELLERFGNRIVGIRNLVLPKPAETPSQ